MNDMRSVETSKHKFCTMNFVMNALDDGWKVKKQCGNFIFTKKHENKREVFDETYLENFVVANMQGVCIEKKMK